jgi:hypothetical protein
MPFFKCTTNHFYSLLDRFVGGVSSQFWAVGPAGFLFWAVFLFASGWVAWFFRLMGMLDGCGRDGVQGLKTVTLALSVSPYNQEGVNADFETLNDNLVGK